MRVPRKSYMHLRELYKGCIRDARLAVLEDLFAADTGLL